MTLARQTFLFVLFSILKNTIYLAIKPLEAGQSGNDPKKLFSKESDGCDSLIEQGPKLSGESAHQFLTHLLNLSSLCVERLFFKWEALDKLAFANYNEPWILVRIPRIERKVHIERFCV